ncbi:MAG: ABC transporter substrate-binding protein [Lachnospiraceae bacterium]|nr:ABC transporter substrate-binding protein [Lachnospiraceae bacterium]
MKKHLLLIGILILSVLGGCANATDKNGGADSNEPTQGGSIVIGIPQDLDSLDPHIAKAAGTDEVLFNVFEGLVKPDQYGKVNPAVAESYSLSEDSMKYVFVLRDNVKFHNGDVVTTEDVVYSLRRCAGFEDALDPSVTVESAFSIIKDIYATDNKTVVVELTAPSTELIYYFTTAIIPKNYKNQATAPVGTGPYKFVSYTPLESFVVEKFQDYYGTKPYLDKVTFSIYANIDAAFLELMAGKIDLMSQLSSDQAAQLTSIYNVVYSNFNLVQALFLNNDFEPFKNPDVRKALCMAINRDEINQMISDGHGTIIGSGVFPGLSTIFAGDLVNYYKFDQAAAKKLLADAGYPDGFSFTITIPSSYDQHVATGEVIVEQLKKIGVTAKIELVEWSAWLSEVYSGRKYESTIIGLDANLAPGDVLKRYRSTAGNNFINFISEEFDVTYASALASQSDAEKAELYKKCQNILTENAASVYIQDPAQITVVKKGLGGYTPYPVYVMDISKLYYVK